MQEIQSILEQTKALLKGHFLLTSGRHSEYYVEKIRIINQPDKVEILCKELANRLQQIDCDIVVGPAYGGIVLAYEVAKNLKKQFVFTQRKDEKMSIRSGFQVKAGMKAIIIEDIVTTGGSVMEVKELLTEMGVAITAIGLIVDRSNGKVDFGIPTFPLLTMDIQSWEATECPLCKQEIPVHKPGASDKK